MNKTNGVIEEAGASTSLYNQEPSPPITKRQSVGFPSFLKLFKKNERDNRKSIHLTNGESSKPKTISVTQRNLKDNNNHINGKYNSNETLSPPSSPILGHLSPSSSCDSVLSTATTGFAFIPPSNYQFGNSVLLNKSILFEPDTDTYKARLRKQKHLSEQDKRLELTLRKKYQLYDADTLKSNKAVVGLYDNIQYADRSLPHIKHKDINEDHTTNERKKHRRTASDSSKDKKSGQYVHVKGKRKAPPPPPPSAETALTNGIAENQEDYDQRQYRTLPNTSTIGSTLGRKKRKAPPPPPALSPTFEASSKSILAEGLFDDKEIKALIEGTNSVPSTSQPEDKENEMKESPLASKDCEETNAARRLTEQQKQILIDNIVKSHVPTDFKNRMSQIISSPVQNEINQKEFSPQPTPVSPISPRPWYKRPMSSNRDSAIPFKREIVLKTMEKRKSKYKDKDKDSKTLNALGDAPPSRSSIFDAGHKFGFFSRNKDTDAKEKEKRRSGIGIPNISELDREAAEIVNRENANCRAKKQAENDKFFSPPEHLILQQQMFGSTMSSECAESSVDATPKVTSTKDLISKFEASTSNVTRITLNTSFIGRTENFVGAKSPEPPSPIPVETKTPPSLAEVKDSTNAMSNSVKPDSKAEAANNISKILWTCPFCTLVNPNWRIICEACECIKPYGKEANPVKPSKIDLQPKETKPDSKPKPEPVKQDTKTEVKPKKPEQNDWEKKAEKVMKYFMPRTTGNALSKSSSETTVNKKMAYFRKSPSPSKLPVSTPKLDMQLKQYKNEQTETSKSQNPIPKIPEEKEATTPNSPLAETKKELLDSSAIVTTITPVFYAQTAFNKNAVPRKNISRSQEAINIEEIRSARLAKFSKKHPTPAIDTRSRESISLEDHDSLEREKKRLREMIRRMNAKALAEKYPVLNKNASTTDLPNRIERTPPDQQPEIKIGQTQEANKLGAIKKMFTKTSSTEKPLDEPVNNFSKPKKVSSSAQTTGIVKLPDVGRKQSPDKNNKHEDNSYAYILKPDKNNSKMKEKNIFAFNEPVELRKPQPQKLSDYDHFKVQEISQQLISVQGRNEFKETLRNPFREMSRTDTIALNKIMRNLELAIAEGQDEMAAQIAMDLAKMKITLHVTKQRSENTVNNNPNKNIIVDISVEDRISKKGPIQITVMPLLTVTELKEKMFMDFGIPVEVQKWTINNQSVLDDKKTLLQYGVKDKAAMMNLYLVETNPQVKEEKKNNLEIPATSIAVQEDIDDELSSNGSSISHNDVTDQEEVHGAAALPVVTQAFLKTDITPKNDSSWTCPLCTLINLSYRLDCIACCTKRPVSYKAKEQPISKLNNFVIPDELKRFLSGETVPYKPEEAKNDLNKATANRKSSEIFNIVVPSEPKKPSREKLNVSASKTGEPPQPQLPIFSSNVTKLKYRGVDNYNPNRKDPTVAATGTAGRRYNKKNPAPPVPKQTNTTHYQELLSLDTSDYVPNVEEFDCPICLVKFETGEGVILRDCLHTFCKDCIKNTVQYSDEAEVKCPYMDNDYSCDSVLQEREIKSIVTREIYELHLAKSVRVAEHQIENAFHCKTPNCRGWCIYEDNVNQFKCPVCKITNCLTCRVIHDGLSCKQYQDRLNSDCDSNQEARRTKEMLNEMVEKGEAMNCPTCQVVMMKKWGCDWLKCSMCKTEICWVTRGPRWGPGGKGDTTAGCKCGVEGKKCHPKCNYCH